MGHMIIMDPVIFIRNLEIFKLILSLINEE